MPLQQKYEKLVHYERNTQGRDFVVGDLHGCLEAFAETLFLLNFDPTADRMFSVGDLVDRGPNSRECAELIFEPWFYCVKGNHEEMAITTMIDNNPSATMMWMSNGGRWHVNHPQDEIRDLAEALEYLPLVITVGEGANRFNIVHAELIHTREDDRHNVRVPITDEMIDQWVFSEDEEDAMLWGRTIITSGHPNFPPAEHLLWHDLEKMSITFVGHTPVRTTVICQRQMYIDGGAVFHYMGSGISEENTLVVACPTENAIYKYIPLNRTIVRVPFDQLQQLS